MASDISISDATDPRISDYRALSDSQLLRDRGTFIAEGRLVVRRLLTRSRFVARSVLVTPAARASLDDVLSATAVPTFVCALPVLKEITGFNIHRGCLAIGERQELADAKMFSTAAGPLVVLEGVGNADNVGLIFRNAAAFGASGVVLGPRCCDPLYRKAIRTSMGAALTVPLATAANLPTFLEDLRAAGWLVLAMTPASSARDLNDFRRIPPDRMALVLGSEGEGLPQATLDAADERIRIAMTENTDSLNVAVAAGVALFALTRGDVSRQ